MSSSPYFTIAVVVGAFVLAAVVVRVAHALVHRLLDRLDVAADERAGMHARAAQLKRTLTVLAYGVAAVASVSIVLVRAGFADTDWDLRGTGRWILRHGLNIFLIAVGAIVIVRVANFAIQHLQLRLAGRHARTDLEWQRRAATLGGILTSLVSATVAFVAILMVLRELSIDIVPILTGAGIAGLAVGFGAQNLVRDVISGFFLILEDQVRIGDLARINGVAGIVEQINLRTIVLRDGEGAVQVFPNGTITALANLSKQFSYAVVDVRIAYNENLDRVTGTIRQVGESMERDQHWGALVLEPLTIVGITSLADGFATLRTKYKTLPLNQDPVANELRKRLMTTFVGRGIRPFAP